MMLYRPSPSVTTVRTFSIRAGLAASTVTPGRPAPDASLMMPAMPDAVDSWAHALGASSMHITLAQLTSASLMRTIGLAPFFTFTKPIALGDHGRVNCRNDTFARTATRSRLLVRHFCHQRVPAAQVNFKSFHFASFHFREIFVPIFQYTATTTLPK